MARSGVLSIDAASVTLLWVPVGALCAGVAVGLPAVWLVSVTGFAALVCTWVYAIGVARPRRQWLNDLEEVAEELWRVSGVEAGAGRGEGLTRADRVTASLRGVRGPVVARLTAALRDLSVLRVVFDATPSPTIATDDRGVVVACNRGAEELTDLKGGAVVGRNVDLLFTQAGVLRLHDAALRGHAGEAQVRVMRGGAARVYQVLGAPVELVTEGRASRGVVLTMRDVTELAQAVHLKTDFVANASHELRTPLSTIRMSVETLEDGAWEDEPMRARLTQVIRSNVQRLQDLVTDLLDLSRLETPEAPVVSEDVAFDDVAEALRADFQQVLEERQLELTFEVSLKASRLSTDRKLLTLILKNLVDNATKFAYEGTAVRVVVEPLAGGGTRCSVIDEGLGIPLDQQGRIFERFYQVDPSRSGFAARRGTGLGLAIVKHAVKTLGGTIRVESVWKQGSTMIVELPA